MAVQVGQIFRSVYADSNALWRVDAPAGRGMWRCSIVNEPITHDGVTYESDYAGAVQGFTTEQVERFTGTARAYAKSSDEHEQFYATLPLGSVVHYDNGFTQFVRCVRVQAPAGQRLMPFELVGSWGTVVRRNNDGSVSNDYHVESILDGRRFEPHYKNIWEAKTKDEKAWSMRSARPNGVDQRVNLRRPEHQQPFDPTTEPAIDLSPPPVAEDERVMNAYVQRLRAIHVASAPEGIRTPTEAREAYDEVLALIAQKATV